VRSFGQLFGITISSTIMSNQLSMKLPDAFVGGEITGDAAYALIPQIKNLCAVKPLSLYHAFFS